MIFTGGAYKLLGFPETSVELTAYELLKIDPRVATPQLVRSSLLRRVLLLRLNIPDARHIPVVLKIERELSEAAAVLSDPVRRKEYDEKLFREGYEQKERKLKAKQRATMESWCQVINTFQNVDGTIEPSKKADLASALQARGFDAQNLSSLTEEFPLAVAASGAQVKQFFSQTASMEIVEGELYATGEAELMVMAERLGIPPSEATDLIDKELQTRKAHREGQEYRPRASSAPASLDIYEAPEPAPPTSSREAFAKIVCAMHPDGRASQMERSRLLVLAAAQGVSKEDAEAVLSECLMLDITVPAPETAPSIESQGFVASAREHAWLPLPRRKKGSSIGKTLIKIAVGVALLAAGIWALYWAYSECTSTTASSRSSLSRTGTTPIPASKNTTSSPSQAGSMTGMVKTLPPSTVPKVPDRAQQPPKTEVVESSKVDQPDVPKLVTNPKDLQALAKGLDKEQSAARLDLSKWSLSKDLVDQAIEQFLLTLVCDAHLPTCAQNWEEICTKLPACSAAVRVSLEDGQVVEGTCLLRPFLMVLGDKGVVVPCEDINTLNRIGETDPGNAKFSLTTKSRVLQGTIPSMKLLLKRTMVEETIPIEKIRSVVVESVQPVAPPQTKWALPSFLCALDVICRAPDSDYAAYGLCHYCALAGPPSDLTEPAKSVLAEAKAQVDGKRDKYPSLRSTAPMAVVRVVTMSGDVIEGQVRGVSDTTISIAAITPAGTVTKLVPKAQIKKQAPAEIPPDRLNDYAKRALCVSFLNAAAARQYLALLTAWGKMNIEFPEEKWEKLLSEVACQQKATIADQAGSLQLAFNWATGVCPGCAGVGSITCKACAGKGKWPSTGPCPQCGGSKDPQVCPKCWGDRKLTCPTCGGRGSYSSNDPFGGKEICGKCGGKGEVPCDRCSGRGTIIPFCRTCNGRGTVTKTNTCETCGGKGKSLCKTCGGGGQRKNDEVADSPLIRKLQGGLASTGPGTPFKYTTLGNPALAEYGQRAAKLTQDQFSARIAMASQCVGAGLLEEAARQLKIATVVKPDGDGLFNAWTEVTEKMEDKPVQISLKLDDGTEVKGKCTPRPFVFVHKDGVLLLHLADIKKWVVVEGSKVQIETGSGMLEGNLLTQTLSVKTLTGDAKVSFEKVQSFTIESATDENQGHQPLASTPITPEAPTADSTADHGGRRDPVPDFNGTFQGVESANKIHQIKIVIQQTPEAANVSIYMEAGRALPAQPQQWGAASVRGNSLDFSLTSSIKGRAFTSNAWTFSLIDPNTLHFTHHCHYLQPGDGRPDTDTSGDVPRTHR